MPLFGACEHCADARAQRDRAQQELSVLLAEHSALVRELVAVKRHELGLPSAGMTLTDPTSVLGVRTKAAIEEMSSGYSDQRSYLTNYALVATQTALADGKSADETDYSVAQQIRMGDTA